MAKKEDRFEVVFQDGSQMKDSGVRQILADKETGVHYLVSSRNNGQKASVCVRKEER